MGNRTDYITNAAVELFGRVRFANLASNPDDLASLTDLRARAEAFTMPELLKREGASLGRIIDYADLEFRRAHSNITCRTRMLAEGSPEANELQRKCIETPGREFMVYMAFLVITAVLYDMIKEN